MVHTIAVVDGQAIVLMKEVFGDFGREFEADDGFEIGVGLEAPFAHEAVLREALRCPEGFYGIGVVPGVVRRAGEPFGEGAVAGAIVKSGDEIAFSRADVENDPVGPVGDGPHIRVDLPCRIHRVAFSRPSWVIERS